jgi:hypothetical protein
MEEWREIPGLEGYEVSSHGRVRSYRTRGSRPIRLGVSPRALSIYTGKGGYASVQIGRSPRMVHQLVALAFIGPRPEGYEVDHIDGDRSNARAVNLRYLTRSENIRAIFGRDDMCRVKRHRLSECGVYVTPNGIRRCRACQQQARQKWERNRGAKARTA